MSTVALGVSNSEFARRVGCNHTYASRLRNGTRMPSAPMWAKICAEFQIPLDEAGAAAQAGAEAIGQLLRVYCFGAC